MGVGLPKAVGVAFMTPLLPSAWKAEPESNLNMYLLSIRGELYEIKQKSETLEVSETKS